MKDKNEELLVKLNSLVDVELKNKLLNEQMYQMKKEKDGIVKDLECRLLDIEIQKTTIVYDLEERVKSLEAQKKNAEGILNELRLDLDKKYKCCTIL